MIHKIVEPTKIGHARTALTRTEVQYYDTFGFLILRKHFTQDEMKTISDEFGHAVELEFKDKPFEKDLPTSERAQCVAFTDSTTPLLAALPEDPRYYKIAEQLLGGEIIGSQCGGCLYVGDTRWHPDRVPDGRYKTAVIDKPKEYSRYSNHNFGCKFALYLEAVDANTGALRVLPRSHQQPFYGELRKIPGITDAENVHSLPGFVCATEPGDVLIFNHSCWHASLGGKSGRPMISAGYYAYPRTEDQAQELSETYMHGKILSRNYSKEGEESESLSEWDQNPNQSLLRAKWIEYKREFGYYNYKSESLEEELKEP